MILNDTIRTLDGWTRMYDFFPMSSTAALREAPVRLVQADYSWTFFLFLWQCDFVLRGLVTYFMHYVRHGYLPIF